MPGILSLLNKTAQVFCFSLFFLMGKDLLRASPNIIISEIHFNPNGPDEAREFIEIQNFGQEIVDISGWEFTNGILYTFPDQTFLEPGQFFVLVANAQFFATQYPNVQIGGQYSNAAPFLLVSSPHVLSWISPGVTRAVNCPGEGMVEATGYYFQKMHEGRNDPMERTKNVTGALWHDTCA